MARCANCGAHISWFDSWTGLTNEKTRICEKCADHYRLNIGTTYTNLTLDDLRKSDNDKASYEEYAKRSELKRCCDGHLLIDLKRHELCVGGRQFDSPLFGFQTGSLDNVFSIEYYDDMHTTQVKTREASSGVETMVRGGISFGLTGAVIGAMVGRSAAEYDQRTVIKNCGFAITYKDGTVASFNVLFLVFGCYSATSSSEKFRKARAMATVMCEALAPYMQRAEDTGNSSGDGVKQLMRASELVEKGLLSMEVFEKMKKTILA